MSAVNRALLGAVAWIVFVIARGSDLRSDAWSHAWLLFAALVLVPLALDLLADADEAEQPARWFRWIQRVQLPAALALTVACWLPPGAFAALAALPWVGVTGLLATIGFARLRQGGWRRDFDGICRDAALMYAAIGGVWTLVDRTGYQPLGFAPAIVTLTAVHFHYAGLMLPLFAGLVQREVFFWRLASRAGVGVLLGVPAVALGITFTQLGWGRSLEAAAGCGLALAGMAVAILQVRLGLDVKRPLATRLLLGISGASLFFAMVLVVLYALRTSAAGGVWLTLPQMRLVHGAINALGFALCGVLAWRRMNNAPLPTRWTSGG
ncbi:YndJ family transporter [Horticoccus sp. 23ND18S-11]|uniref:YndJ family transporter n=1 Tax=Horticoccus sp. 23ND18S-11 TaxID=3391832 RepID=UPI0039C9D333